MNYFITGTSTNVGKTYSAIKLLQQAANHSKTTLGIKPVASGATHTSTGWRNDDAEQLRAASSVQLPYEQHNPFCFEQPIAPHLAAAKTQQTLTIESVMHALQPALSVQADYKIIEGAGGWLVPLNEQQTFADLAATLNWPVIVVVKMELGCINHTLLTVASIQQHGCTFAGWIANCYPESMLMLTENLQTLTHHLQCEPLLTFSG